MRNGPGAEEAPAQLEQDSANFTAAGENVKAFKETSFEDGQRGKYVVFCDGNRASGDRVYDTLRAARDDLANVIGTCKSIYRVGSKLLLLVVQFHSCKRRLCCSERKCRRR